MDWEWHQIDRVGIARFIDPNVNRLLPLEQSVFDLKQRFPQDLTPVIELLYNKLRERQIWYAAEKGITVTGSQKIRRPDEILNGNREGTCLDLALLFCALCLGHQLLPIFVVLGNHALVAVSVTYNSSQWEDPKRPQIFQLRNGAVTDANVLRQLVDSGEYILVECTGFARSEMISADQPEGEGRVDGLLTFHRAVEAGRKQLDCPNRSLMFALDVDLAHRLWGAKPYEANWQDTAHTLSDDLLAVVQRNAKAAREGLEPRILERISRSVVRKKYLPAIQRGITEGKQRVIPLVGPAGYGKTTILGDIYDELMQSGAGWIALVHAGAS